MGVLGGLIWYTNISRTSGKIDPTAAVLSHLAAAESSYDFGSVSMAKGKVSKTFEIKNTVANPLVIEKIYTSCMCTSASLVTSEREFGPFGMPGHGLVPKANATLNPGGTAKINVVFDPAAHGPAGVGPIERVIFVEEKGHLPLQLEIKAVVTP